MPKMYSHFDLTLLIILILVQFLQSLEVQLIDNKSFELTGTYLANTDVPSNITAQKNLRGIKVNQADVKTGAIEASNKRRLV